MCPVDTRPVSIKRGYVHGPAYSGLRVCACFFVGLLRDLPHGAACCSFATQQCGAQGQHRALSEGTGRIVSLGIVFTGIIAFLKTAVIYCL